MFKSNTVFILGAGASKPYGYPTGYELRQWICNDFNNDYRTLLADNDWRSIDIDIQLKSRQKFVNDFEKSDVQSIDLFFSES